MCVSCLRPSRFPVPPVYCGPIRDSGTTDSVSSALEQLAQRPGTLIGGYARPGYPFGTADSSGPVAACPFAGVPASCLHQPAAQISRVQPPHAGPPDAARCFNWSLAAAGGAPRHAWQLQDTRDSRGGWGVRVGGRGGPRSWGFGGRGRRGRQRQTGRRDRRQAARRGRRDGKTAATRPHLRGAGTASPLGRPLHMHALSG